MYALLNLKCLHKSKHLGQILVKDNKGEEHDFRHHHILVLRMSGDYARFSGVNEGQLES